MDSTRTGLTWTDLQTWPGDGNRYELIDGELVVTPAPDYRHQRVVTELAGQLWLWAQEHGGSVLAGPFDVYVHEREYAEPDVLFVRAERVHLFEQRRIAAPPDLVVEVSSPSTRGRDLGTKRDLYEQFGVAEYWFVDLDADRVLVHRLVEEGYGEPTAYERGDTVTPLAAPGLALRLDRVFDGEGG